MVSGSAATLCSNIISAEQCGRVSDSLHTSSRNQHARSPITSPKASQCHHTAQSCGVSWAGARSVILLILFMTAAPLLTSAAAAASPSKQPCGIKSANSPSFDVRKACGPLLPAGAGTACVEVQGASAAITISVTPQYAFGPGTHFSWGYFFGAARFNSLHTSRVVCRDDAQDKSAPCSVLCSFADAPALAHSAAFTPPRMTTKDGASAVFSADGLTATLISPLSDLAPSSLEKLCQEEVNPFVQTYLSLRITPPEAAGTGGLQIGWGVNDNVTQAYAPCAHVDAAFGFAKMQFTCDCASPSSIDYTVDSKDIIKPAATIVTNPTATLPAVAATVASSGPCGFSSRAGNPASRVVPEVHSYLNLDGSPNGGYATIGVQEDYLLLTLKFGARFSPIENKTRIQFKLLQGTDATGEWLASARTGGEVADAACSPQSDAFSFEVVWKVTEKLAAITDAPSKVVYSDGDDSVVIWIPFDTIQIPFWSSLPLAEVCESQKEGGTVLTMRVLDLATASEDTSSAASQLVGGYLGMHPGRVFPHCPDNLDSPVGIFPFTLRCSCTARPQVQPAAAANPAGDVRPRRELEAVPQDRAYYDSLPPPCGINGSDGQIVSTVSRTLPSVLSPSDAVAKVSLTLIGFESFKIVYDFTDSIITPTANTVIQYYFFESPVNSDNWTSIGQATYCNPIHDGLFFFVKFGAPSTDTLPDGSTITISGLVVTIVQPIITNKLPFWGGLQKVNYLCYHNKIGGARLATRIYQKNVTSGAEGQDVDYPGTYPYCQGLESGGPDNLLPFSFVCNCSIPPPTPTPSQEPVTSFPPPNTRPRPTPLTAPDAPPPPPPPPAPESPVSSPSPFPPPVPTGTPVDGFPPPDVRPRSPPPSPLPPPSPPDDSHLCPARPQDTSNPCRFQNPAGGFFNSVGKTFDLFDSTGNPIATITISLSGSAGDTAFTIKVDFGGGTFAPITGQTMIQYNLFESLDEVDHGIIPYLNSPQGKICTPTANGLHYFIQWKGPKDYVYGYDVPANAPLSFSDTAATWSAPFSDASYPMWNNVPIGAMCCHQDQKAAMSGGGGTVLAVRIYNKLTVGNGTYDSANPRSCNDQLPVALGYFNFTMDCTCPTAAPPVPPPVPDQSPVQSVPPPDVRPRSPPPLTAPDAPPPPPPPPAPESPVSSFPPPVPTGTPVDGFPPPDVRPRGPPPAPVDHSCPARPQDTSNPCRFQSPDGSLVNSVGKTFDLFDSTGNPIATTTISLTGSSSDTAFQIVVDFGGGTFTPITGQTMIQYDFFESLNEVDHGIIPYLESPQGKKCTPTANGLHYFIKWKGPNDYVFGYNDTSNAPLSFSDTAAYWSAPFSDASYPMWNNVPIGAMCCHQDQKARMSGGGGTVLAVRIYNKLTVGSGTYDSANPRSCNDQLPVALGYFNFTMDCTCPPQGGGGGSPPPRGLVSPPPGSSPPLPSDPVPSPVLPPRPPHPVSPPPSPSPPPFPPAVPPCGLKDAVGIVGTTVTEDIIVDGSPATVSLTLSGSNFIIVFDFGAGGFVPQINKTMIQYYYFEGALQASDWAAAQALQCNPAHTGLYFFVTWNEPQKVSSLPNGTTLVFTATKVTITQPIINNKVPFLGGYNRLEYLCMQNKFGGVRLASRIFTKNPSASSPSTDADYPGTYPACPSQLSGGPTQQLPFSWVCDCANAGTPEPTPTPVQRLEELPGCKLFVTGKIDTRITCLTPTQDKPYLIATPFTNCDGRSTNPTGLVSFQATLAYNGKESGRIRTYDFDLVVPNLDLPCAKSNPLDTVGKFTLSVDYSTSSVTSAVFKLPGNGLVLDLVQVFIGANPYDTQGDSSLATINVPAGTTTFDISANSQFTAAVAAIAPVIASQRYYVIVQAVLKGL